MIRPYVAFRRRFIDEADRLLAGAKAVAARAAVARTWGPLWNESGDAFEQAARLYNRAGLGLMARHALEQAGGCFRQAGLVADAERCDGSARAIAAYWEEVADG